MEVAKLILNVLKAKAHMTLSVKPFGCMPSSGVSDGVQSVVTELYPEAIFCAVETSGEGAVNFYSRVQMFLFKARQRAQAEMDQTLAEYGITRQQAQEFLASTRYGHALYRAPHRVAGSGADLIHQIGPLVGKSKLGQARVHAERAVQRAREFVQKDAKHALAGARRVAPYLPAVAHWAAKEGVGMLPAMVQGLDGWRSKVEALLKPSAKQADEIVRAEQAAQAPVLDTVQLRTRRSEAAPPMQVGA
jgi:hypothetical protein